MKLIDSFPKVTREQIIALCDDIEIKLPDDYIEFLISTNGGQPEQNHFLKKDNLGEIEFDFYLNTFFGVGDEDATDDLLAMFSIYYDNIPESLLPIGADGVANIICIGLEGDHFGKVYIWWKDKQVDEGEKPTFENINVIADSFTDFIKAFK